MAFFKRKKNLPESAELDWKEKNAALIEAINKADIETALALGQEMVDYVDRTMRRDNPKKATTYNNMGMVFMMNGDYELADECFRDALAMRKRIFGKDHNEIAVILLNMAELYRRQATGIMSQNRVEA
ncbi:MAG: tetratricopeptide repeat protein [Deltaproteobacteria bacterium]|nr:tetratricopeptide repeat protein [Deltaproteobacteria bacterium]